MSNSSLKQSPHSRGSAKGPGMGKGPGGGHAPVEKAKNFGSSLRRLTSFLKPYRLKIIVVLCASLLSTAGSVAIPRIIGIIVNVITNGLEKGTLSVDVIIIFRWMALAGAIIGVILLFNYLQGFILVGVTQKVVYSLRKELMAKMQRISVSYFDSTPHGDVMSRLTNDVDLLGQSLNQSLNQSFSSLLTVIGSIIMMFIISPIMAGVVLVLIPILLFSIRFIVKRSQRYFKKQQKTLGELNGHIEEIYSGHVIIKAYGGEADSIEQFNRHNEDLCRNAWKAQFFSGLMMPFMHFFGNFIYVVVAFFSGYLSIFYAFSLGDIVAFLQYVSKVKQPLGQMANIVNVLQSAVAAAERIFEFLDKEELTSSAHPVVNDNPQGSVEFKDIAFGYTKEKTILHNFSAFISPGCKVAIVGPTGAGKTTIINLLMRFYDPDSGTILIDGKESIHYSREELRRLFGMVLQETWLFNGTIRENIAYGNPKASDEEIFSAAKAAHADHFIHTLPNGYDFILNEEADNISLGQKQLLTIARAFLINPPMLILDEATSSVDTRTEVIIQRAMDRLMAGRTSFVIAHRLSTIRDADTILVVEDGTIVEQGNHKELLVAEGAYFKMYNSQFG